LLQENAVLLQEKAMLLQEKAMLLQEKALALARHCSSEDLAEVAVSGDIDLTTTATLEAELRAALSPPSPRCVLVDLTNVLFMGVAGLEVLAAAHELAEGYGVRLGVYGATRAVRRPLELSRLAGVLNLYPSRSAATADLGVPN
jgi:anti-anti-sigma factor